jgi:hypothetical protein
MTHEAIGTYENGPADETPFDEHNDPTLTHATLRRRFNGAIEGESIAHVLISRPTPDRVGYVATDRFEGTIGERAGGFVFQHGGPIDRGQLRPFGYIVPGSGTGDFAGVTGEVVITFTPPATHNLKLVYDFEL